MSNYKFKDNFLWGGSSSAFQIEGAYNEDGRGLCMMDLADFGEEISGFKDGSDHYHRYKEDIKLMAEMGFKEYRFSISWPRIFPNGAGEINQKGVDFYNNLLDELIKYKIEPVVTIFHFDLPMELVKKGGFKNTEVSDALFNYGKTVIELFGKKVKYWLTINEQNMLIFMEIMMAQKENPNSDMLDNFKKVFQVNHNMNVAQAKIMQFCHEMYPDSKIGPAPNISCVYPLTSHPDDYDAAFKFANLRNWLVLDPVCKGWYAPSFIAMLKNMNVMFEYKDEDKEIFAKAKPNFMGINYYSSSTVKSYDDVKSDEKMSQQTAWNIPSIASMAKNNHLTKTEYNWEIDPKGFTITLKEIYDRYGLPILITENGLGAKDTLEKDGSVHDQYRIEYLKLHITALGKAIQEGVDVIGYSPWSAIDLVSTHEGIEKRYGFVYVNRGEKDLRDMNRYKKDSFYWYQKVISSNGTEL